MGAILTAIVIIILAAIVLQVVFGALGFIVVIIAWMAAGWLAGQLLRGRGYGPVVNIILGLVGGILGSLILRAIGFGWIRDIWGIGEILVGAIGAIILVWVVRLLGDRGFGA